MPSESKQSLQDRNFRFYLAGIILSTTFVVWSLFLSSIFVHVQGYLQKELTRYRREYKMQEMLQTIEILLASIRSYNIQIGCGQSKSNYSRVGLHYLHIE